MLASLQICTVDRSILESAIASILSDFEDAVQLACAISENLDAIVTRDAVGFASVTILIYRTERFARKIFVSALKNLRFSRSH